MGQGGGGGGGGGGVGGGGLLPTPCKSPVSSPFDSFRILGEDSMEGSIHVTLSSASVVLLWDKKNCPGRGDVWYSGTRECLLGR